MVFTQITKGRKVKLYVFKECNDWEGETWRFFVRMTDEQAEALREIIKDDESYSLTQSNLSEDKVAEKIADADGDGYMPDWQDLGILEKLPEPSDKAADEFYKGQIANFCKPVAAA